jgi:hypothetical protein
MDPAHIGKRQLVYTVALSQSSDDSQTIINKRITS